jgi:hypothetical protein
MADDKMKSEDMAPQADKQAHTEIAEREGKQGEQARPINKEEAERGRTGSVQQPVGEHAAGALLSMRCRRRSQPVNTRRH